MSAIVEKLQDKLYNFGEIRNLLEEAFTVLDIISFCEDNEKFNEVTKKINESMSRQKVVAELLRYARSLRLTEDILNWAEKERKTLYNLYKPKIRREEGGWAKDQTSSDDGAKDGQQQTHFPESKIPPNLKRKLQTDVEVLNTYTTLFFEIDEVLKEFNDLAKHRDNLDDNAGNENWQPRDAKATIGALIIPIFEKFSLELTIFWKKFDQSSSILTDDSLAQAKELKKFQDSANKTKDDLSRDLERMLLLENWRESITESVVQLCYEAKEMYSYGEEIRQDLYQCIRSTVRHLEEILEEKEGNSR